MVSYLRYVAPVYLALAYEEKKEDVEAVLVYQKLIVDLDEQGAHNNNVSGKAYAEWLRLRDNVIKENPDDPRVESIQNFRVPDGRNQELLPLIRLPPKFPPSFSRGSNSGVVKLAYDIDAEGFVTNPKIVASTDVRLHKPSIEAINGWRFTPNIPLEDRQSLETSLKFDLRSETGRIFPVGELVPR